MTQSSKLMMEVKQQNTEKSKGQRRARDRTEGGLKSPQAACGVGLGENTKQQVAGPVFGPGELLP